MITKARLSQIIQEEMKFLFEQGYARQGETAARQNVQANREIARQDYGATVGGEATEETDGTRVAGTRTGDLSVQQQVGGGQVKADVRGGQVRSVGGSYSGENVDAQGNVSGLGTEEGPRGGGSVMFRDQGNRYGASGRAGPGGWNVGGSAAGQNWNVNAGYGSRRGAHARGSATNIGGTGIGVRGEGQTGGTAEKARLGGDVDYEHAASGLGGSAGYGTDTGARGEVHGQNIGGTDIGGNVEYQQNKGLTGGLSYGPASVRGAFNPTTGETSAGVGFDFAKLEESKLNQIILEELDLLLQEHAKDYIWGVKAPYHRAANQYQISVLNHDILKEKGKHNDMACG